MKDILQSLVRQALEGLVADGALALESVPDIPIERSRDDSHGDYATPVAMGLARAARKSPRDIAELIVSRLGDAPEIAAVEIAGPGFPKVAAFKNSPRGVRLSQDDDGTVRAKSTKPETQGQSYLIELIMSTGEERSIKVTAE